MNDAYAAADLVVSRAGFGTLTELAAVKKAAIVLPKGGHQEENVAWLAERGAVMPADERTLTGYALAQHIKYLLEHTSVREAMGQKLHELLRVASADRVVSIVAHLIG